MELSRIPPVTENGTVNVLVEIPKGGHVKYEVDERYDVIRYDRALHSAVYYPAEYGLVPQTVGEDGDHLDAMVIADDPTFPGCLIEVRLLGALRIAGQGAPIEHKLLGVPLAEPRLEEWRSLDDVPAHVRREIEQFFDVFKQLEGSAVHSRGWVGHDDAADVLRIACERWRDRPGDDG